MRTENKTEIDKSIDRFFENPIHRLIFARLGQIDGDNDGKIDWDWLKNGDKKRRRNEKATNH